MLKKILVVPDVHGRIFWKEPVARYIDSVDKVVFLGDYLDPYHEEDGMADDIFENLLEIVELKRKNMGKVVLLKGNHDQHYYSELFRDLAGGTRMDKLNWGKYHAFFCKNEGLFQLACLEDVKGRPFVFSHAGMTVYWLHKVNTNLWHLPDNKVSIGDPEIIDRINLLDKDEAGQTLLSVVGSRRSWFGEKTGSILWTDIQEHSLPDAPKVYGMDEAFQVFGHSRLREGYDKVEYGHLAMIDSRQCFMVDEGIEERIVRMEEYEKP